MNTDWQKNETIQVIMGRRSIRLFEKRPVEQAKVDAILACAFAAPNSKNYRPCHFIVVDDQELLSRIGASAPLNGVVGKAPLAIAVCVDVAHCESAHKLTDGTWIEDSAAAMENILLAARSLGLEGVWLKVLNRPDKEGGILPLIPLPEGVKMFGMAVLGYAAEKKEPYEGVDRERLHHNRW